MQTQVDLYEFKDRLGLSSMQYPDISEKTASSQWLPPFPPRMSTSFISLSGALTFHPAVLPGAPGTTQEQCLKQQFFLSKR